MNLIIIYPGRFQPFGNHHYLVYSNIKRKFPKNEIYIVTSNKVALPNSPFDFNDKKKIINSYGISNVIQVKNPYVAKEVIDNYDKTKTAVIFILGEKDKERLKKLKLQPDGLPWFLDWKGEIKHPISKHAYVYTAPLVTVKTTFSDQLNASAVRKSLSNKDLTEKEKKNIFIEYFGTFKQSIYDLVVNKLTMLDSTLFEFLANGGIKSVLDDMYINEHKYTKSIDTDYDKVGEYVLGLITNGNLIRFEDMLNFFNEISTPYTISETIAKNILNEIGIKYLEYANTGNILKLDIEPTPIIEVADVVDVTPLIINTLLTPVNENQIHQLSDKKIIDKVVKEIPKDVLQSFEAKETLNPDFWKGSKLNETIRKKLIKISEDFASQLDISPALIEDITLTGSIANYNWSKYSDVDLHLRVDFSKINSDTELVKKFYDSKKTNWNLKHKIMIKNHEVEIYVENIGDTHIASGLYSILNNKWITEPTPQKIQIDKDDIETKALSYISTLEKINKLISDNQIDEVLTYIKKIKDKLKNMRKAGLETGGEYSTENLVFKVLRRNGFIETLLNLETELYDQQMTVESAINETLKLKKFKEDNRGRTLLMDGGAAGHMSHPFEDKGLSFSDLKKMIKQLINGQSVTPVVEKTDGQNIFITYKNNQLLAARNKTQLKTPVTIEEIAKMFSNRGEIYNAFVFALTDLESAIKQTPNPDELFGNGKYFANIEIIYSKTKNVISYGTDLLQFHSLDEYDENGKFVKHIDAGVEQIITLLKETNLDIQNQFKIIGPHIIKLNKSKNAKEQIETLLLKLDNVIKKYKLSDKNTIEDLYIERWKELITNEAKDYDYELSNEVLQLLIDRWAKNVKSVNIKNIQKQISDPEFSSKIKQIDTDVKKINDDIKEPLEHVFLLLGVNVLKNITNYLATSQNSTVQDIINDIDQVIKDVEKTKDPVTINKLNSYLSKIELLGGFDNLVPSEGIVFKYNDKLYKLTGLFAPINALLGLLKYGR